MIDLTFTTPSKTAFLADLQALGQEPGTGLALCYEGPRVLAPAEYDADGGLITPPVYSESEYAHLRLYGPDAKTRARALRETAFANGTRLDPAADAPFSGGRPVPALEDRKRAAAARAVRAHYAAIAAGFSTHIGGQNVVLKLDENDQNAFARLATKHLFAQSPGTTPVTITDAAGQPHTAALEDIGPVMIQYGDYFETLWADHKTALFQIAAATTETEIPEAYR